MAEFLRDNSMILLGFGRRRLYPSVQTFGAGLSHDNETLRWPTNLDRDGIVRRLIEVREAALKTGLPDLASLYADVESMPSPKIGAKVIAGISMVQESPEHQALATQLSMVAMNLKNLK